MKKPSSLDPEIFKKITQLFDDFFYEKQRACGLDDISNAISISKIKASEYLQIMLRKKQIHEIFSGKGQPTLYIPGIAIREMIKLEPRPKWIGNFSFKQKDEINYSIQNSKNEIEKYDSFERILYANDKLLESSLAIVFNFLGFESVAYTDNPQKHDIEFYYKNCLYLIEAKGKTGQADKDDVLQLRGWIDLKLEEGLKAETLQGILIVNSYRHLEPNKRVQEPFTEKAKQFLRMNKFIYSSTSFIYKIIRDVVEGKIDMETAREKFIAGEFC